MKTLLISFIVLMASINSDSSLYGFKMKDIQGKEISLDQYKGKVVLIVNTASKCGYTKQYKGLEAVYKQYKDQGLVILGFPANNFGGQEPGSDEQIAQFCELNFGVTFPLFSKVSVRGDDQHPLFAYLTTKANKELTGNISWNFEKFLIDKEGNLIKRFPSRVDPESETLIKEIKALL